MPVGSSQIWNFVFTNPGTGTPYALTGITSWEYVARPSATDATSPPLIDITLTTTTPGVITVTATASLSQVQLTINPAATSGIAPAELFHALWSNPGTSTQFCWLSGPLILQATAQP